MPGSPTENNHRMAHSESPGLWRQSKRLSSAEFSRPAGAPYKAQGFFHEEENWRLCVNNHVLKQAPRRGPTLGSMSVSQPVEADAEACSHALSGVLLQKGHPIAFESQKKSATEGNQACQANGPMRDASTGSTKENSVAHDGRSLTKAGQLAQKNGVCSLEATQPGVTAMKKSSTDGSPTMSVGDGQYVLSPPVDFPCMRKEPQTRNIAKKWKRRSNTVRANLERVLKQPKRWADGKHRPFDLHVEGQNIVKS